MRPVSAAVKRIAAGGTPELPSTSRPASPVACPPARNPSTRENGRAAIDFYRAAFGAVEDYRVGGTDANESVVAQLSVRSTAGAWGGSRIPSATTGRSEGR